VEERKEKFFLRKLRKPGERERGKYCAPCFEISHTKRENFSLRKLRKIGEREKENVVLLLSSTLASGLRCSTGCKLSFENFVQFSI
jgi:hypothetical protein